MLLLPRYLSRAGVASRRAAEELVVAGRVTVNGRVCRDVLRVLQPGRDRVALDGAPVEPKREHLWLALNKPRGVLTTTHDPEGRRTVMALVQAFLRPGLAPVGRLDQDSAGLLLLTDDHALAARLLDPASHVEKTYRVKVRGHPDAATLARLAEEARVVDGERLGPMGVSVEREGPRSTWLEIRLSEGKNRQIRRRMEAEGHPVETLIRLRFGPVALGALAPGEARPLEPDELSRLRAAAQPPAVARETKSAMASRKPRRDSSQE